jgi:beta-glucosidase
MPKLFATTNPAVSDREKSNMERARKIASQGMVLLSNNGVLPLKNVQKIALFGNGARHTVKGGTGSGDVNSRMVVNVEQGLEAAGFTVTTKAWMDRFDAKIADARAAYFAELRKDMQTMGADIIMKLFTNPFIAPAITEITKEDIEAADTDTAVFVIARNSGEGKDRRPAAGEYELFEEEKAAIEALTKSFAHVVVVLNVGAVIDTKFLRAAKGIDAILLMSQAGNIGGYALADVLTGAVTPSGHLASTWAENYQDYPGSMEFSHMNGDVDDEYYKEGIYVGYRYFDTFGVTPAYPFGYGLSYTTFDVKTEAVTVENLNVKVTVTVKNTGDTYSGKEVVQVYYSAPEGTLEKAYQELAAYAKTKELAPGESQTLTLQYSVLSMASYDTARASYVLEAGEYLVRVGTNSRNTHMKAVLKLEKEAVTEVLSNRFAPDCEMEELSSKGAASYTYETEASEKAAAPVITLPADAIVTKKAVYADKNPEIPANKNPKKLTMDDVKNGAVTLDELVGQLTIEEMAELCVGTARGGDDCVIGSASAVCPGAAGDSTSLMIDDRNIRNMILADGPAGLRLMKTFLADKDGNQIGEGGNNALPEMEELVGPLSESEIPEGAIHYYQYCTAIPIATLLAQTWDLAAVEEAGDIVGEEMTELGITLWLAPGMNIHRNPLCGRNFEYYSEDPLVAGLCAAADTIGVQKHPGVGTTIKHFAFNNQEDNRMHTNAHVSERAIREIYLKGFEIVVKTAQPMSIMTSYNLINGIHTANSYDLLTAVAREEWGFLGIVMTDWGTTGSIEMEPGKTFKYGCSSAAGCIKAGNDLTMPGCEEDVKEIIRSVGAAEGSVRCPITLGDLQACAKRMLNIIMQSSVYENAKSYASVLFEK